MNILQQTKLPQYDYNYCNARNVCVIQTDYAFILCERLHVYTILYRN